jgi:hypothetical protein
MDADLQDFLLVSTKFKGFEIGQGYTQIKKFIDKKSRPG